MLLIPINKIIVSKFRKIVSFIKNEAFTTLKPSHNTCVRQERHIKNHTLYFPRFYYSSFLVYKAARPSPFPWTHFYESLSCEDPSELHPENKLQAATTFHTAEGIEILEIKFDIRPDSRAVFETNQVGKLYPDDKKYLDTKVPEIHGDMLININYGC